MSFIEVKLPEWDCSKVTVGVIKKNQPPTILYDGKMAILTIIGNRDDPYIVSSFKGVEKQNKYNASTKVWTDEWTGEWSISMKLCESVAEANPMQAKLMSVFDDIINKVKDKVPNVSIGKPIGYKYIKKEVDGFDVDVGVDKASPAYMNVKVPYTCDDGCEMMKVDDRMVPVFTARRPKPQFYNVTEARDRMLVKDVDRECKTSMKLAPKIMISLFKSADRYFITRRLLSCYYEPVSLGLSSKDDDMIDILVGPMEKLLEVGDIDVSH